MPRETPTMAQVLEVARSLGAISFSPPPMRAVRGVSFTFEQLSQFVNKMINPSTVIVDVGEGRPKLQVPVDGGIE